MLSFRNRLFYTIKPLIPRTIQIHLRRNIIQRKRGLYTDVWPIDKKAGMPPDGWQGWPDVKKFALILTHDVDTAKGHEKCYNLANLEKQLGFRSSFNLVPERYKVSPELRQYLKESGFDVGVHGLYHDGKYYKSRKIFQERAVRINHYLKDWGSVGFSSPSMLRNLDWLHELNIEYDVSTFDTDPFEPQHDGVGNIFPFRVPHPSNNKGYVELPYTLPQDFTLFVLMQEKGIEIWKKKLDWIAEKGGMALLITHPDYMNFDGTNLGNEEYPVEYYIEFLEYIKTKYEGQYWHALPRDMAHFWTDNYGVQKHEKQLTNLQTNEFTNYNSSPTYEPIRVCMLAYSFYEMDGRIKRYAETLAKNGIEVDVIALKRKGQTKIGQENGVNIYRIQERIRDERGKLFYLLRLLKYFIKSSIVLIKKHIKRKYDLIHVHNIPDFEVFAAWLPKLTGAKVILDIHDIVPEFYADKFNVSKNSIIPKLLVLLERVSIAFSDHVIISNHLWQKVIVSRSVREDKCTTIINYPDINLFNSNGQEKEKKDNKFIMLYPGSLNHHQGLDIAIRAVSIIKEEVPEMKFYIYGDGPAKKYLETLVAKLNLEDKVLLKGYLPINDIVHIMADADLGIVPKRADNFGNEAFSTKVLEFMSLGVPVVVSDTKIDKYYFNSSIVKFFKAGDENDLAESILVMIKDYSLRNRLANNALKFIEDNNWEVKKKEYLELVDRLIGKQKNST